MMRIVFAILAVILGLGVLFGAAAFLLPSGAVFLSIHGVIWLLAVLAWLVSLVSFAALGLMQRMLQSPDRATPQNVAQSSVYSAPSALRKLDDTPLRSVSAEAVGKR